jgi:hypothetical protein
MIMTTTMITNNRNLMVFPNRSLGCVGTHIGSVGTSGVASDLALMAVRVSDGGGV